MKILVTGATGFIGTRLIPRLVEEGHDVTCVARSAREKPALAGAHRWLVLDLAALQVPPESVKADAVIYLAQSRRYREFPDQARDILAVNANAVLTMLDWARSRGVRSFVYASSANVYGAGPEPLVESAPMAPASFYGQTKQIGEMLVGSYAEFFECTTLRLFTVYGHGQAGTLIPSLVDRIRKGDPIQLQGADGLRLSPVVVDEAAHFLAKAIELRSEGRAAVFNLGGPEGLNLRQLSQQIGQAVGREPVFNELRGPEPGGWLADLSALREAFGSVPQVRFRDGIRQAITAP